MTDNETIFPLTLSKYRHKGRVVRVPERGGNKGKRKEKGDRYIFDILGQISQLLSTPLKEKAGE
jgi:hypothetical protein